MMHICAGLVGAKTGKVENMLVLTSFFDGSRRAQGCQEDKLLSEPGHIGHFGITLG